jgi:predicted NBD/HSP70 family sugar kinase
VSLIQPRDARAPWPGLPDTERRVLLELLVHGSQSRVRLAERLGLSRTSLTRVARELLEAGLVSEGEAQALGTRGRPAETLHLRPDAAHFLGVKLTGEALYLVLADLGAAIIDELSEPLVSREVPDVVAQIADAARQLRSGRVAPAAIGIAAAGDVTRRGGESVLERSSFLGWDKVPLARLVAEATDLPAVVANDVHALAGAHHWFGGASRYRSLVVYGLGAGIGSAIVLDNEVLDGAHGRAGRVGHARVGGVGRACENGHVDCVHSFVTMTSIEHNAGVDPGGYAEAVRRAALGDRRAQRAFEHAAYALGVVVADAVNAFDPEAVSIMGEGLDMLDIAPEQLRAALGDNLEQGDPTSVRIERPPFHFDLYARGAAVAAMRELLS